METKSKIDRIYNIFLAISIALLIGSLVWFGIVLHNYGIPWKYQKPWILSSVPKELRSNVYLTERKRGCCKSMTGDIAVTVVMVSDSVGQWDEESTAALKTALETQGQNLATAAASYRAELSFQFHYYNATMIGDISSGDYSSQWQDPALESAGLPSLKNLHKQVKKQYSAKESPLVFVFNKTGRAYAELGNDEFIVLYVRKNFNSFQHEIAHIFGAKDYYYPTETKELAGSLFEDSLMMDGEVVDSLTAYLIGWTEELPDNALQFLQNTNHMSADYLKQEGKDQSITGNSTRDFTSGTYTGDLVRGEPHGTGTMVYHNGGWYTGQWKNGSMAGEGTGKIIYKSGSVYEGTFLDGEYHGEGTLQKANGDWFTGTWEAGTLVGYAKGKVTYDNGATYEGEFQDRKIHGQGTYTYETGSVYTGQWSEGKKMGFGTMVYANGSWYKGNWNDNQKIGPGTAKEIQSSGVYEGEVLDGKRNGQGTYTWTNGEIYVGQWTDGKITGYGTVTKPDGSVYTGYWIDGVFQG